jgi:ComF family protein
MHRQKLRKRGFNTAFRLAKVAADHYQLPLLTQAIERVQHTTAQAGLNRQQRQENLRHAFETKPEQLLGHQHILLIDDVYTTGATLHACSKSLQQMGVKKIDVMTLARALPPAKKHQHQAV